MNKLLALLLILSIIVLSFSGCSRTEQTPPKNTVPTTETVKPHTMAEAVDSNFVSYEEILIDNKIVDTPLLFFTERTESFAREIISDKEKKEEKKNNSSDKKEKTRHLVEKRTFGFDDDTVKDMEITFYLPTTKYNENDMNKYGKEYEKMSFAEVIHKKGDTYHTVTITFVDLEYKENVSELTKKTDLVIAENKHISMKKTKDHLVKLGFSRKY